MSGLKFVVSRQIQSNLNQFAKAIEAYQDRLDDNPLDAMVNRFERAMKAHLHAEAWGHVQGLFEEAPNMVVFAEWLEEYIQDEKLLIFKPNEVLKDSANAMDRQLRDWRLSTRIERLSYSKQTISLSLLLDLIHNWQAGELSEKSGEVLDN